MEIRNVRLEHSDNRIGIDNPRPVLSWTAVSDKRGDRQRAYRMLWAASLEKLTAGKADLWDSGRIESSDPWGEPYGGLPLAHLSRYYVTVRVWDAQDSASAWSEPFAFETAFLHEQQNTARWISMAEPRRFSQVVLRVDGGHQHRNETQCHGMYLRTEFTLPAAATRARAYVCGLGYYDLWVNGAPVGDRRLDPGQTDYKSFALYSAIDLDGLLKPGANAVGIVLGNGRHIAHFNYPDRPKARAYLHLELADGSVQTLVTDSSWKTCHGPIHENSIYAGEHQDARDEQPGWAAPGLSEAGWTPAVELEGPPLRSQMQPPIRVTEILPARSMHSPCAGIYVFDFGQNFAGVARMRARGPRGTRVELRFAELLDADGNLHVGTNRDAAAVDTFILKGSGDEVFEPRFTYHGFRYVEVSGYPGVPDLSSLEALVLHTDLRRTGSFGCSCRLVDGIRKIISWSQRSNIMSIPTDCPQREERMGWLGDAQLASEQAVYNYDMAAFYRKYLADIAASQREDGSISDVTPPYWPLYPADPAWGTAYPSLLWALYFYYGDTTSLARHYDGVKAYVDFLASKADDHIVTALGKYGDWCPPASTFPKRTPMALTSTWYYYHDTLLVSRMAAALGRDADERAYRARAAAVLEAFNRVFHDHGRYATLAMSPIDRQPGMTSQTLPLFLDMVPSGHRQAAVDLLLEEVEKRFDYHVDTGIVGTRYLFEVLRDTGHAETAWKVVTRTTYPSFGYMLAEGATTLWERWEYLAGKGMNSHNHIMFGSIDAWFYRTLAGIVATAPAWKEVSIRPHVLGDLRHAAAFLHTPRGELSSAWVREAGCFLLDLRLPVGTNARVFVPNPDLLARLYEGDVELPLTAACDPSQPPSPPGDGITGLPDGIGAAETACGGALLRLGSGCYRFSWRS